MITNVTIKGLSWKQFRALDHMLKTEYPESLARKVCAVFLLGDGLDQERHVEIPISELDQVLYLLDLVDKGAEVSTVEGRLVAMDPRPLVQPAERPL